MMRRALVRPVSWMVCLAVLLWCGCTGPIMRPQSPEAILDDPTVPHVPLVSEYTHPYGLNHVKVEAVSLATGLAGTGEDPPPTPQRATLLSEMSRRKVDNPAQVLASPNTALVLARGFLRPGIQQGDRFDVEVRVPSQSESTSLRGGWLLPARLSELAVMNQRVRKGHDLALADGPILVDPSADSEEDLGHATRGRVLGGGIALKSRSLGLIIAHPHQSVRLSQDIAQSINRRFHIYDHGRKQGVATPKTEEFVELQSHDRYQDNIMRYVRVVRNIAVKESARDLQSRLLLLEHQLQDPLTAATAALRLEAIGTSDAIDVLKQGTNSSDPEVRFYAAEALAYLDETSAVPVLADAARSEPAFRVHALGALSAMDDVVSYEALRSLLSVKSAETRYGAFRALWAMNEHDGLVRGEQLGEGLFSLHILDVEGPSMVHVTRSFRPEIVIFGKDQQFQLPLVLDAGPHILVNGMSGAKIIVSKFHAGEEPEQRVVSTSVDEVIRAIVELGGSYPDTVQALQQAKKEGALVCRFRVDALPAAGRSYDRSKADRDPQESPTPEVATPRPELFADRR